MMGCNVVTVHDVVAMRRWGGCGLGMSDWNPAKSGAGTAATGGGYMEGVVRDRVTRVGGWANGMGGSVDAPGGRVSIDHGPVDARRGRGRVMTCQGPDGE